MVPPWASTMPLTMYSPRPVPPRLLPRQKRVKTRFMDSSGMPVPSSLTVTNVAAFSPSSRSRGDAEGVTSIVTVPSPCRTAFEQVAQDLVDLVRVGPQRRQGLFDAEQEAVGGLARGDVRLDVAADGGADVDGLAAHFQSAGVDAGDVEQSRR